MTRVLVPLAACVATLAACSREQESPPPPQAAVPEAETGVDAAAPPQVDTAQAPESEPAPQPVAEEHIEDGAQTAMDLYRLAQAQMNEGKRLEGYETARAAMQQFIADGDDLAWMMLESVELGNKRVDVHFNMGPRERDPSIDGIVKPLSFRVWSTGEEPTLLRTLDYENGRFDGRVLTAAIGEQRGSVHSNLGMLEPSATYEEILQKVVEIVEGL